MTKRELLYIVTICDEGTVLAASARLHISQPSLSQSISKIEKDLGTMLFLRNGKHLLPTRTCMAIVQKGRDVLEAWNDFENSVQKFVNEGKSEFTVGMPAGICRAILPYILSEMESCHPEVHVNIIEERSDTVEQMITEGKLDLGILHSPLVSHSLGRVHLFDTTDYLAVSKCNDFVKTHPYKGLNDMATVSLNDIGSIPFVLMQHHKEDHLINEILHESEFTPNIAKTTSMWINVVDYIKNGNYAGLVDEIGVHHDQDDERVAYYRLDTVSHRTTYAVYHPKKILSRAENCFIECSKRYPETVRKPRS